MANCDWVIPHACNLLQCINYITKLLIMRNYFNYLRCKVIRALQLSLIYALSRYKILVPKAPVAREI